MSNKNIFYATNPAKISDALWQLMVASGVDVADMLIFLPSRRAVRSVEKMIVEKSGGCAILPRLVALGEGTEEDDVDDCLYADVISDTERVVLMAKLLAADACVGNLTTALPIAHDLVRMQNYLENEGIDAAQINWVDLVDEKYATHFQNKARILNILSGFMAVYAADRITATGAKNRDIRSWINVLGRYKFVVVCASTASVPATADLMRAVAQYENGRIILSGKISGRVQDFILDTNPYNSEYKFLDSLNIKPEDVLPIDVGDSAIDFMNYAFGNDCSTLVDDVVMDNVHLVCAPRESVEAEVVANIAQKSIAENKSVLVITPDAAGNQRIAMALAKHGIVADFSGGMSGSQTAVGRAILNMFDAWIEQKSNMFDKLYEDLNYNLFDTIAKIVDENLWDFTPEFVADDDVAIGVWGAIKNISDALGLADIKLDLADARAFVADAIAGVSVRPPMNEDAQVVVLGTIESRMQTADVVILTGLNEGMFPARGYENAWLPRCIAKQIGLPAADRKVSLQSLDFMNLSCGKDVYWVRATVAGGVQTTESRFLSRVVARRIIINSTEQEFILNQIAQQDFVEHVRLDYSAPNPPADWSDVYVTDLEYLINNPYAFYVKHILKLRVLDDYWVLPDARKFGTLVHDVIEHATDLRPDVLVAQLDARARDLLGAGNIVFFFWHKRFLQIAPLIATELSALKNSVAEIDGCVKIASRNVRARADRVWDGGVMDIKTGEVPSKKQLLLGNVPQLPLEAFMLQSGGFKIQTTCLSRAPIIKFLQLKNNNVCVVEYDAPTTQQMINGAVAKVTDLFNIFSVGQCPYEYRETSKPKYHAFDDLARIKD